MLGGSSMIRLLLLALAVAVALVSVAVLSDDDDDDDVEVSSSSVGFSVFGSSVLGVSVGVAVTGFSVFILHNDTKNKNKQRKDTTRSKKCVMAVAF